MNDYLDEPQRKMLAAYQQGVADEAARCVAALESLRDQYAAASLPNTGLREAIVALKANVSSSSTTTGQE